MLVRTTRPMIRRALALHLLACAVLPAAAQEEQYRERQRLDPQTGQWLDIEQPPEIAEGPLADARRLMVAGEHRPARDLLETWIEANPYDERYYEAVYLLGEAEFVDGDYWAAYGYFEQVAENTAGELFSKALEREMDVARAFLSGRPRIVAGFMRLPAYDDGVEILDRIWQRAPGTRVGEEALKLKADYFFESGDMDLAQDEYVAIVREYPAGRYVPLAMLRSAEAAQATFRSTQHSDAPLVEAEERYRQVQDAFPQYAEREAVGVRLEGIREQRAEKDLAVGRWYERVNRTDAAAFYYRLVVQEHPDTLAAAEARLRLEALE